MAPSFHEMVADAIASIHRSWCLTRCNLMKQRHRTQSSQHHVSLMVPMHVFYETNVPCMRFWFLWWGLDTWSNWKNGRAGDHAEYLRQLEIIHGETREQLQILVGSRIPRNEYCLTSAFAEALKGYRPPSRSRSREGRWRHPIENNSELEQV